MEIPIPVDNERMKNESSSRCVQYQGNMKFQTMNASLFKNMISIFFSVRLDKTCLSNV
jgi:hypothetical protein